MKKETAPVLGREAFMVAHCKTLIGVDRGALAGMAGVLHARIEVRQGGVVLERMHARVVDDFKTEQGGLGGGRAKGLG